MRTGFAGHLWFATLTLGIVAWWAWLQFQPAHDQLGNFLFNTAYAVPFFAAAVLIGAAVWRWRRTRPPENSALVLLAISLGLYGLAQVAWTYDNVANAIAVPSYALADVFFVASVLLRLGAVALLLLHQLHKRPFRRWVSAACIALAVAASFASVWGLFGALHALNDSGLVTLETFYATISFLTIFLILLTINRDRHGELRPFLYAFFLAAVSHGTADFLFAVRERSGAYWNGDIADAAYALGAVLCHFAALQLPAAIDHRGTPPRDRRVGLVLPLAIVAIGLLAAVRVGDYLYTSNVEHLHVELEESTGRFANVVRRSVQVNITAVQALAAFVGASTEVTDGEFAAFVAAIGTAGTLPDVRLGFVGTDGRIRLSTRADLVGTDYAADPTRARLLEEARLSGRLVVSEPMTLASAIPGVVLLAPVFRGAEHLGTAVGSVRLPELLTDVSAYADLEGLEVVLSTRERRISSDGKSVYDLTGMPVATDPSAARQAGPLVPSATDRLSVAAPIPLGPVEWQIDAVSTPERENEAYAVALTVFFGIVALVLALGVVVYLLVSQRTSLQEALELKTQALRKNIRELERYRFYLDGVSDAVVVTMRRRILYHNQALLDLFRLAGKSVDAWDISAFLADPSQARGIEAGLGRDGKWDGEVRVRPREGGERDVQLAVRPVHDETGAVVAYLTVARDVTERKAVERAKTQFVSMVAHQLRAPMTQIRWLVEQLKETPRLPAEARAGLDQLEGMVTEESRFVGDLLNVSRIERGVLKLNVSDVPVSRLLADTVAPLQEAAKERKVALRLGEVPKGAKARVDAEKAAEAIRNVVDNAIKYSPKGKAVDVAVERADGAWVIAVTDRGAGVPEELWDTLFDIKTEISPNATGGSAGLGLYLTRKFLVAMGGAVAFKTGEGGTTFRLRLPAA